jgi:hypothetical protein
MVGRLAPSRPAVVAAAVLGLVVVAVLGNAWRTGAAPFEPVAHDATWTGPATVGVPYLVGSFDALPDVVVRSAEVVVADGSVPAAAAVTVCRRKPNASAIGALEGSVIPDHCDEVLPLEGLDLGGLGDDDHLLISLLPLQEGPLTVHGFRIRFQQGIRTGTQHIGETVRLDVRRERAS